MISQLSPWRSPPESLLLKREQVHVWRASLIQPSVDSFRDLLDPKKRDRADRFHFPRDRDRFIIARGILRDVLSRYLAAKPGEPSVRRQKNGAAASFYREEPVRAIRLHLFESNSTPGRISLSRAHRQPSHLHLFPV